MINLSRYAFFATSAVAIFTGTGCANMNRYTSDANALDAAMNLAADIPADTVVNPTDDAAAFQLQKSAYNPADNRIATPAPPITPYPVNEDFDTWDRVFRGFQIPHVYNQHPRVQQFVRYYGQNPEQLTMLSERASVFLHMIVYELDNRHMPMELALLPFVESAFNPDIFSRAGAAGLWQFIPSTGSNYGLLQTKHYDARLDPFAATGAALTYLQKLHAQFNGDWLLALAAYNCGEGRVEQAIAENRAKGQPTNFWNLPLPKETREYVPRLLAFKELLSHARYYGIQLPETPNTARLMQLRSDKPIDLTQLAITAGLHPELLTSLNPCFRKGITTPEYSNRIILPREYAPMLVTIIEQLPPAHTSLSHNAQRPTTPIKYARTQVKGYNQLATVRIGSNKKAKHSVQYANRNDTLRTANNNNHTLKQVGA